MSSKRVLVFLVLFALAAPLFASRGMNLPQRDPRDQAVESYNDGLRLRDRAWGFEKELAAAADPSQKTKIEEKIRKTYLAAVRSQKEAVRNDRNLFQAWSELGYALRKTGDYPAALEAYDKALAIQPNYADALEYRGEAFLGVDRVGDAREAYLALFNGGDAARAKMLAEAMSKWVERRRAEPAGVNAQTIDDLAAWLAQRAEISSHAAATTTSGSWK